MDIPIKAEVICSDGSVGESDMVIINPISLEVRYIVVKERGQEEKLVPIDYVTDSNENEIYLSCTKEDLSHMDPLVESEFVWEELPDYNARPGDSFGLLPYVVSVPEFRRRVEVHQDNIAPEELEVKRGAKVESSDGHNVGKVDEFLINPDNHHISHIVMREGHLWGQKHVTIPISSIDHIGDADGAVHLNLNRDAVEGLPAIPIKRR